MISVAMATDCVQGKLKLKVILKKNTLWHEIYFSKQKKKTDLFPFQHTIKFIWRFTKLVLFNDRFSLSQQYLK